MNQRKKSRMKVTTTFNEVTGENQLFFIILPAITIGGQNWMYHIECSFALLWGKWSFTCTLHLPKRFNGMNNNS